jgi:hypothetical protein
MVQYSNTPKLRLTPSVPKSGSEYERFATIGRSQDVGNWREVSRAQNAAILQKALQFSKSTSRRGSLCLSPAD